MFNSTFLSNISRFGKMRHLEADFLTLTAQVKAAATSGRLYEWNSLDHRIRIGTGVVL